MDVKRLLKEYAYQNIPLMFDDAYALGCYALQGCTGDSLAQVQSIAVLSALHNKATYRWRADGSSSAKLPQSAAPQIAGICAAIFEKDIACSEFGFLQPKIPYAMDNCGMGGDLVVTANVSTLAALIASSAGIPMCKHGSPANTDEGRYGSSDFVEVLGINTYPTKQELEACVETENFGYSEALDTRYKLIHMQTHKIAMLPHMNDVIGPITNPLDPKILSRRVLGVNHLVPPKVLAEAYQILNDRKVTNLRHGLFVRGFGDTVESGMDEVSICLGGTQVVELKDGVIREYHLDAEDFGLGPVSAASISPPQGMNKGEFSLRILKGEIGGAPLAMVLANAAMLFYLAEASSDLKECYRLAKDVHESGAAYRKACAVRMAVSA